MAEAQASSRTPVSFQLLALRDAVFLSAVGLLWWAFAAHSQGAGMLADFTGVMLGLALAFSAYLLHEWGHALGAMATGARMEPSPTLGGISLFSFDSKNNDKRQFLAMSLAGFAVTALAVSAVYTLLPDDQLVSRVARGGTLFLASLTIFIEVPLLLLGLFRSELPPIESFELKGDSPFNSSESATS